VFTKNKTFLRSTFFTHYFLSEQTKITTIVRNNLLSKRNYTDHIIYTFQKEKYCFDWSSIKHQNLNTC